MDVIKKNDFIEVEYTGRTKEGEVFDTTDEKTAKDNHIFNERSEYKPSIVCVGENHILKGLDDQLVGKETGQEYNITVTAEDAFGKKDARMIRLIPTKKFLQQRIQPTPGLQVNIDGAYGTIKTVSGGRCLVDFNHPLSGKDLVYTLKVNKLVEDDAEKIKALLKIHLYIKDSSVEISGDSATVKIKHDLPDEVQEEFKKIVEKTTSVKNLSFISEHKDKQDSKKAEQHGHEHQHEHPIHEGHDHASHEHDGHDHSGHQH